MPIKDYFPSINRFQSLASILFGLSSGIGSYYVDQNVLSQLFETLAVAEASLLAIIVSVGLLSVQISATRYTPLIGRRFMEQQFLSGTILLFGIAISISLLSMILIPTVATTYLIGEVAVAVFTFIGVGVATVAFSSLLSTKDHALEYLDPRTLLEDLENDVSFEDYRSFSEQSPEIDEKPQRSPVLEIFQIGQTAFEDKDGDTALQAIHSLYSATMKILREYADIDPAERRQNIQFRQQDLFSYWKRLIDAAVDHGPDTPLHRIRKSQREIGIFAAKNGIQSSGREAAKTLQYLSEETFEADRLEKGYYADFSSILQAGIENEADRMVGSTITYMQHFAFTLRKELGSEFDLYTEAGMALDTIFATYRDNWKHVFAESSSNMGDGPYRKMYKAFEENISHYLTTSWLHDLAYPPDIESDIAAVAVTAAEHNQQWAVSRLTRMLIELWVIVGHDKKLYYNDLARIMDAGGSEGVEDAFEAIRQYPDGTFESIIAGFDGYQPQADRSLATSVLDNLQRRDNKSLFIDEVNQLQDKAQSRYENKFA